MAREYKYSAKFSAVAKCVIKDSAMGKSLAIASLQDLKQLIPEGAERHEDMLPIAGNLAVVNLGNCNGHLLGTREALSVYKKLSFKYINLEHDSSKVVGVIASAKLTKFDSNYRIGAGSELIEEPDQSSLEPFNISIAGYVWDTVAPGITKAIIESNDPNSPDYMSVSFSWEVLYSNYCIMRGDRERGGDVEIIDNSAEIESLSYRLKSQGGDGKDEAGLHLYELVCFGKNEDGSADEDSVIVSGCALTMTPAGDVAGIVTKLEGEDESFAKQEEASDKNNLAPELIVEASSAAILDKNNKNISHLISQPQTPNVILNRPSIMKVFKNLDDVKTLNDENAKEYALASVIPALDATLKEEISKAVAEYDVKANEAVAAKELAEKEATASKEKVVALEAQVSELSQKFSAIAEAQVRAEADQKYSSRLEYFDKHYELTDEDRSAIASRLKDISDESFEIFKDKEFAIFAKEKNKEVIASKKTALVAVASVTPTASAVADAALASVVPATPVIPDATQATKSLKERFEAAFGANGIQITAK